MSTSPESNAAKAVAITQLACEIAREGSDPDATGFEKLRLATVAKIAGEPSQTSKPLTETERVCRLNDARAALEGLRTPDVVAIQRGTARIAPPQPQPPSLEKFSFSWPSIIVSGERPFGSWLGFNPIRHPVAPTPPASNRSVKRTAEVGEQKAPTGKTKTVPPKPSQSPPATPSTDSEEPQPCVASLSDVGSEHDAPKQPHPAPFGFAPSFSGDTSPPVRIINHHSRGAAHNGCPIVTPEDSAPNENPARFPITCEKPSDPTRRQLIDDFLEKYSVTILGIGKVAVILPPGVSPLQLIQEGDAIATQLGWPGVLDYRLEQWSEDPLFKQQAAEETVIAVEGGVPGSTNKNIQKQINTGYIDIDVSELAAAAIAYLLAKGEDFFSGFDVRAARDTLRLLPNGLQIAGTEQHLALPGVRASRRLKPEETGISLNPPASAVAPDTKAQQTETPTPSDQPLVQGKNELEEPDRDRVRFELPEGPNEKNLLTSFISQFDVQPFGLGRVRLVIPKGVSRIELINRAHSVATELRWLGVTESLLDAWRNDPVFTTPLSEPLTIEIDSSDSNSTHLTFDEQVARGYNNVTLPDLAAAHLANLISTGEDLFSGCSVRSQGGTLVFRRDGGLQLSTRRDDGRYYSTFGSKRLVLGRRADNS